MSGPWAEFAPLYVRTAASTAMWPLRLSMNRGKMVCGECGAPILRPEPATGRTFLIAELTDHVGDHIPGCRAVKSVQPDRR